MILATVWSHSTLSKQVICTNQRQALAAHRYSGWCPSLNRKPEPTKVPQTCQPYLASLEDLLRILLCALSIQGLALELAMECIDLLSCGGHAPAVCCTKKQAPVSFLKRQASSKCCGTKRPDKGDSFSPCMEMITAGCI
jgi:hypothetical protein